MSAPLELPPFKEVVVNAAQILSGGWTRWMLLFWARVVSAVQAVGNVTKNTQSASIPTTTVYVVTAGGLYRVSYRQRVTTAASVSSSLTNTITWREGSVTQSIAAAAMTGNTTSTFQQNTYVIRADSGTVITYAEAYASVGGTAMVFNCDVAVERVV